MSIELDITKLPAETIRRITRTARGFLKKFPNIHTIIIDRGEGVKTASEYKDFHLFLFMGEESDYDIVHDNEYATIYRPRSTGASCKLGRGTKWCTAAT